MERYEQDFKNAASDGATPLFLSSTPRATESRGNRRFYLPSRCKWVAELWPLLGVDSRAPPPTHTHVFHLVPREVAAGNGVKTLTSTSAAPAC